MDKKVTEHKDKKTTEYKNILINEEHVKCNCVKRKKGLKNSIFSFEILSP